MLSDRLYERDKTFTLANYALVLQSTELRDTLATTVAFAVATTMLSVALGVLFAVLLTRTDLPGRRFLHDIVILPFYVSPLVLAFAWAIVYGPSGFATIGVGTILGLPTWQLYTVGGMAVVAAVYFVPYSYLYATGSLALTDPQLEDASRIAGAGPFRTLWSITLPLLRPAILSGTLLTLVSTVELLSIPLVLGQPVGVQVLATFLYGTATRSTPNDYGIVAATSVAMLVGITLLVWLQTRITGPERRYVTVGGKAIRGRVVALGAMRWPVSALLWLYIAAGVALPLLGIFAQASTSFLTPLVNPLELLTLDNFKQIFEQPAYVGSIRNSLIIATVGGLLATVFIAFAVLVTNRSDFPLRGALAYVALYPRAIPGIIVGIGFLWTMLLIPGLGGIRNTLIALTVAFTVRFLPIGFGAVMPSVLRISGELDRASRVAGASWLTTMRAILVPLLRPALASAFVLLFVSFLKEYASALFLVAGGSEVIGTTMIEFWRQGNSGPVAALAATQLVLTLVAIVVGQRLLGARLRG
ncbi:MAG TPA: iron ABC transporter permease [Candidatus Limnocylindria bacterium]|nr:iron ABC transporter permease [Candidatus Limnocylindria bacterium]